MKQKIRSDPQKKFFEVSDYFLVISGTELHTLIRGDSMGYQVDYQPIRKVRGIEKKRTLVPALTGVCLLLFVLLVNTIWPRGAEVLRGLAFSGDISVTAAALDEFALELRSGEELPSAFETFCRTVIRNAQFDTN